MGTLTSQPQPCTAMCPVHCARAMHLAAGPRTEQQVSSETLKMHQVLSLSPRIPAGREGSSSGVPTAHGRSSLCCLSAPACRGGLASCGHLPQVSAVSVKTQVGGGVCRGLSSEPSPRRCPWVWVWVEGRGREEYSEHPTEHLLCARHPHYQV